MAAKKYRKLHDGQKNCEKYEESGHDYFACPENGKAYGIRLLG
jgi:hypothetical protein